MNVALFTNTYKPTINGVVNCIALIKQGLAKRGHRAYVFAPAFNRYRDEEEDVYRYPSLNLAAKVNYPVAIPFSASISAQIPKLNLDIIHSHHPFLLGKVGATWAKRLNLPLIFTFHTQYEQYAHYIPLPRSLVRSISRALVTGYTRQCSYIITPGTSIVQLLDSYGIRENVYHMPNAIDLERFSSPPREEIRTRYGIQDDEMLLIYVGRMAVEKNLGFMLQAFAMIRGKAPARLMIMGEGPELENLKGQTRSLNLEKSVIFTGGIDYREIVPYYGAADIFIMTSTTEVKPLALLEAMASGLPVVAVAAHGSSDTIIDGENGYLTEENLAQFTEKVLFLMTHGDTLLSMREKARDKARGYSIDSTTEKLVELYQRALEDRGRKASA
jgi:1,2-diacylglycerol 3-alpha-glucosyltransferase